MDERLLQIQVETMARVGTELLREVHRRMRLLEGEGWHGGEDFELLQLEYGRLAVRIGDRDFVYWTGVRPELIAELKPAGEPTSVRLIDAEGVVVDVGQRIDPNLN